ncbi:efflux RND transporter periplasmic adaptor subunit [Solimonas marina]|uniref:Efflux RND transporter periplasmic adaptor subunit n=1 Tax=Solimonas marina TaxID=2714601 RepID=A0A969W6L1_9GAMM|nr:efflux RND transporter periplasmic adaptor subunit [Solimonas marina]NKF21357.1 efflux RND transporter periplasmic adaptor subunit [Solimonas marina]
MPRFLTRISISNSTLSWLSLGLLVLAAAGMSGCESNANAAATPPAPQVTVRAAVQQNIVDWDTYTGRFAATQRVELRPRVAGYIDRVAFDEGSVVKQGQLLFQIDPRPFQARLDQAKAELARAQSQQELAKTEAARAENLLKVHAISREEYDSRASNLGQTTASLRAAQAAVESAALDLSFTRVTAPIGGRVSRAEVTAGNYVSAGQTILTSVVSVDPIYVYFDGDERSYLKYAAQASRGERPSERDHALPVFVGLADENGFPHAGRIDFLDNALDPQTGTIRARAVLPNPDGRFTPGLFARVQLLGSGRHEATLLDERAIGTDQSKKFVYVVDDQNKVQYRAVTLGSEHGGLRVVTSGVKPGERVIVAGLQRVRPGVVVATTEEPAPEPTADAHDVAAERIVAAN